MVKELFSLSCMKYKVLKKSTSERKVTDADVFTVNKGFTSKLRRIVINQL